MFPRLLALVLVAACALGGSSVALAEGGDDLAKIDDPALVPLREALAEFKQELADLKLACGELLRSRDREEFRDCKARYGELRERYAALRELALELAGQIREWWHRLTEETTKLRHDAEKEEAQRKDRESLGGKGLQEKLRWVENAMLETKVDLETYRGRAQELREQAGGLTAEQSERALELAALWEEKAERLATQLEGLTADRAQLLAAIAEANKPKAKPKPVAKKETPKQPTYSTSWEKYSAKLKDLDAHMADDRRVMADYRKKAADALARASTLTGYVKEQALLEAAKYEHKAADYEKGLVQHERERQDLTKQLANARAKIQSDLSAVDEKIAYKRSEQERSAKAAEEWRAKAGTLTGGDRERALEKAAHFEASAKEWAGHIASLVKDRQALAAVLERASALAN